MKILKQIIELLFKFFVNKSPGNNKGGFSPEDTMNPDDVKTKFISGLHHTNSLFAYSTIIGNTEYIFEDSSWESARSSGVTDIKVMCQKISKEVYWFLYKLATDNYLSHVYISSLWRPNASIHTIGIAVELGKISSPDGDIFLYNNGDSSCPELVNQIRKWSWKSGLINQYIGPWHHKGILGWRKGWHKNKLKYSIELQHQNHIHITVKVGR